MSPSSNLNNCKETGLDGRSLLPLSQTARKPKSKTARMKSTLKTMIHPVRSRREKKARKKELKAREEAERLANISDFLECGRLVHTFAWARNSHFFYHETWRSWRLLSRSKQYLLRKTAARESCRRSILESPTPKDLMAWFWFRLITRLIEIMPHRSRSFSWCSRPIGVWLL